MKSISYLKALNVLNNSNTIIILEALSMHEDAV